MRLENILALTKATLVNEPFVTQFENIVFEVKNVKRGDLFIAFNEEMIKDAILNGAYGIMFDKRTQISDREIAWIKVSSCEDALKKLLRFRLIEKDVTVYECNEIVLKLALQIITDPHFIPLDGDIQTLHKVLWNVEENTTLLFTSKTCDKNLFTNVKKISTNAVASIDIVEQTLFETSFIYNDVFYERQLLSPFFIPYLEDLLHLYKHLKINFRLKKFTLMKHFEAVFVSKNLEIKEFGTSDKVLIFESNIELIEEEISFLQKNALWAELIYIIPHAMGSLESKNIYIYKDKQHILNILNTTSFHFALIAGTDTSLLSIQKNIPTQLTLDF
ncbi:hypothetical protein JHD48_08840 [Sulfurimonas sp. SAG-AH-194-I05]|nr:hypothetical protein [Sulfurimonas sp. SAG-AH-194-I05]MDF1875839.1 hypothetical protein [Sulfurimonas sp. SAG-AH-194-I05]